MSLTETQLLATGRSRQLLAALPGSDHLVHQAAVEAFLALQQDARTAGFELTIASSYRDFYRQCAIWNAKVSGERDILDDDGRVVKPGTVSEWELVQAILRWSALPGASRHHWGTDMDVFDRAAVTDDYRLQLTLAEADTVFGDFHHWLSERMEQQQAHGFFRPYAVDCGGIGCEPWHISFAPAAHLYENTLTPVLLTRVVAESNIKLAGVVIEHMDEIFHRFVVPPQSST